MRVLVCGAHGFLGREVVRALVRDGHDVLGLVRSGSQREAIAHDGATPVVGDVLDRASLAPALRGCDAAVHLAQAPGAGGNIPAAVRVEGAANLRAAGRAAGVRRLVVGSGYWVYRSNPGTITEESPLEPIGLSRWNFEAEQSAKASDGPEVVVLRPGMVYGNGSWFREMVSELLSGAYRYAGEGRNRLSPVSLWDAGEAFRWAVTRAPAGSTYLVVDDQPVSTVDFASDIARRLGAPGPQGLTAASAVQAWGEELVALNVADRGASNAHLRSLGWRPRYPTYPDGVPSVLEEIRNDLRPGRGQ